MATCPHPRLHRSLIANALIASALVSVVACSRTPPEPTPAATPEPQQKPSSNSGALTTTRVASRCITPLSQTPPPIPPPADSAACPRDPEPNFKVPTGDVSFPDAPAGLHVEAEIVKSEHDVERGLMYRRSMADSHGMLFKLDSRREHTFWMHNTCISLDIMYIDEDGVIVGIAEAAEPLTDSIRTVGCPSRFVLEVNGGWARKHGVKPGQKVTLPASVL